MHGTGGPDLHALAVKINAEWTLSDGCCANCLNQMTKMLGEPLWISLVFLLVVANDFLCRTNLDKWTLVTANSERNRTTPLSNSFRDSRPGNHLEIE